MMLGSGTMRLAKFHTDSSKVAEKSNIWQLWGSILSTTRRKGSVTRAVDQILELSVIKYAHLWIRMLWSWWPCVSIMTSASSSTNTRIFLGSKNLNFPHQSSIVPGVPITICSWSFVPFGTEIFRRNKESLLKLQLNWENATINKVFEEKAYIYFLWWHTLV